MLYKPEKGKIWDPSIMWHEGMYYMFSMHMNEGCTEWDGMWLNTSQDGVHWKGYGRVLEGIAPIWKMFIFKCGDKFILNHGSLSGKEGHGNDTLRFFESRDLIHWEHICDNNPDPRWYNEKERWDHMYVIPKKDEKGYWGYVVATPTLESSGAWGMQQSIDGIQWEIIKPPQIEWGSMPISKEFEIGGCEKIGDKYYLIGACCPPYAGNYGYSMYTFTSDSPTGPFKPDVHAFRLCGFSGMPGKMFVQGLACWCKAQEGLLISNYIISETEEDGSDYVWLLPIKRAIVDENGHLHLGYWKNNEAIKGNFIDVDFKKCTLSYDNNKIRSLNNENLKTPKWEEVRLKAFDNSLEMQTASLSIGYQLEDSHMLVLIDRNFDLDKGIVLEGSIKAYENTKREEVRARCWRPSLVGFYMEEKQDEGLAIMMEVGHPQGRHTYIREIHYDGCEGSIDFNDIDSTGPGCATVAGVDSGKSNSFRLFLRRNMFELYIDDLLVQTFVLRKFPTGRFGFVIQNARCIFENLNIWKMEID